MQYMLLIYSDESRWADVKPEQMKAVYDQYMDYGRQLTQAGALRGGAELKPVSTATTLRMKDGKVVTLDGPFAETKEQLGGYYIIEAENLEKALEWAAKCPGIHAGSMEVRPLGMGAEG